MERMSKLQRTILKVVAECETDSVSLKHRVAETIGRSVTFSELYGGLSGLEFNALITRTVRDRSTNYISITTEGQAWVKEHTND